MRLRWLGTDHLTWGDLLAIVRQSPHGSALHRAIHGEDSRWDLQSHLLAVVADLLAAANWQRGGDAQAKKPTPIPRPGATQAPAEGETIARGKPVSIEQMNALLGWDKE